MCRSGGFFSKFPPWQKRDTTILSKTSSQKLAFDRTARSQSQDSLNVKHPSWKSLFSFTTFNYLLILLSAVCCSLCSGAMVTINSYLLGKIFGCFTEFNSGSITNVEFKSQIATYNIYIVIIATSSWVFNSVAFFLWHAFSEFQARNARVRIFNSLLVRKIEWFDRRKDGTTALTIRLLSYIHELQRATSQPMSMVTQYSGITFASFGLAFYLSWKLTAVILATTPIVIVLLPFFSSKVQPNLEARAAKLSQAAKFASSVFNNIETVKFCNGEDYELRKYSTAIIESGVFFFRQALWNALQVGLLRLTTLSMFVQGFWFGTILLDRGQITGSKILTSFWAAILAVQALIQMMPHIVLLEQGRAAGQKLEAVVSQMSKDPTELNPVSLKRRSVCIGDMVFSKVTFAYPSRPKVNAICNVNLFFAAGETTFVIGKSGSGKSTIGQILAKFYNTSEGSVTLDGMLIQELDPKWLRQCILLVEQQSNLFEGTIQENIAMGSYDISRDLSKQELASIIDASDFAKVRTDIEDMPRRFKTKIGVKGISLSGGQRQRITLARAWLRNPPILVLDESTSALDHINRVEVMDAVRNWRKGRTTIIITHDISQILPDDFVYVMKDGYVVEEGYRKALESMNNSLFHDFLGRDGEGEIEKPLNLDSFPPTSSKGRPSESFVADLSFKGNVGTKTTEDAILESYINEPGGSKVIKIPTVFSQPIAQGHRRQSLQCPTIVAPFWKAIPPLPSSDWTSIYSKFSEGIFTSDEVASSKWRFLDLPRWSACRSIRNLGKQVRRFSETRKLQHLNEPYSKRTDGLELCPLSIRKRRRRTPNRKSQQPIDFTLSRITATIRPHISVIHQLFLGLAVVSTVVFAISTPIFAFVFSKLMATLYSTMDRRANATKYSLMVLAVSIVDGVSLFVSQYLLQYCGQVWTNNIRINSLRLILAQPRKFFDVEENAAFRLSECLDQHGEEMQHILGRFLGYTLIVATMLSIAVIWSLVTCWKLTLVLLASFPVIYGITNTLQAVTGEMDKRYASSAQNAASVFAETFTNIKTVRSLTTEDYFREKHKKASDSVLKVGIRRAVLCSIVFGSSESILFYLTALLFFYGSTLLASGDFTLNAIFRVMTLLLFSVSNTTMILSAIPEVSIAREAAGRLLRLASLSEHCHEHEGIVQVHGIGDIVLHGVNFSYPSSPDNRILKDVSLTIPLGHCVALVGLSGSGKSTIAKLLLNLYPISATIPPLSSSSDITSDITFSSRSIKRIHTPTLRSLISIVNQTPTILPATVAENIAYGLHRSSPFKSQKRVEDAARAAGVHSFIASLPYGYDTLIGEGGTGLSGGQAQRIAIARALIRQPNVLILDEATSALDVENAALIRDTISGLLRNDRSASARGKLTVIIITHSRDMMRVADWICMLDKGRVVEVGPYNELVRKGGRFAALVSGRAWEKDEIQERRQSLLMMRRASGIVMDELHGG